MGTLRLSAPCALAGAVPSFGIISQEPEVTKPHLRATSGLPEPDAGAQPPRVTYTAMGMFRTCGPCW